ncbi:hypothetical protein AB0D04_25670 [Streptomyces sp. NPDC048483]|uniref:hypothetical protein n=1 Tax=Streptomyces sp. NPDC048483 TaxID=3154927 RepID=UPI00344108B5
MSECADAGETLRRAAGLEKAARARSGWYARCLWAFAAWQLVFFPMALLWHGSAAPMVYQPANALLVAGLSVYAARQRVVRRGFGLRHGVLMASWGVAFGLTLALGYTVFVDSPAFAAAGAVVCALPLATGAWLEMRRSS